LLIVNGAPTDGYPSVGFFDDSFSGVLISPTHVLTAGESTIGSFRNDGSFELGGESYGVRQIYDHPDYDPFDLDQLHSLTIVELDRPVAGIEPSKILRSTPTVGAELTLVGFGSSETTYGVKYAGITQIDEVATSRLSWLPGQGAATSYGDIGAPTFVDQGGELLVAGVALSPNPAVQMATRVDVLSNFIDDVLSGSFTITDDHFDFPEARATSLTLVDQVAAGLGNLEDRHDRDAFSFVIAEPSVVQIDLRHVSADLDTVLAVYDFNGQEIAWDDDGGGNSDSRVVRTLNAGTYYLTAASYVQSDTGQYEIDIRSRPLGPDEAPELHGPNAPEIAFDELGSATVQAGLQAGDDIDVFRFSLSERTNLEIEFASQPSFQLQTSLLDVAGATLDEEAGLGGGTSILRTLDPGTYFVRAAATYDDLGLYDLRLHLLSVQPDPEPTAPSAAAPFFALDASGQATYSGALQTTGDRDAFRLTIASRSELYLRMDATESTVIPQLRFYDEAGALVADSGAHDGDTTLEWLVLQPGDYFVEASAVDDADIGAYRVSVVATADSPTVPLPQLELDEEGLGSRIGTVTVGSRDLTAFTLTEQSRARIDLQRAGVDLSPYLRLYDRAGQLIAKDFGSGDYPNSRIERSLSAGTYYVSAADWGDYNSGEYRVLLQVIRDDHLDDLGPNVPAIVVPETGDTVQTGSLDFEGDRDAFRFDLSEAADARFELTSSAFDAFMRLYDGNGVQIASDDDSGEERNSRIERFLLPGTYFVVASAWDDIGTGPYTLFTHAVRRIDPEPHVLPDLTTTGSIVFEGGLSYQGDRDAFDFVVLRPTRFQFDLTPRDGGDFDPFLRIVDRDSGRTIDFDDNGGADFASQLRSTLPAGHYSVVAEAFGDLASGNYRLEALMSIGDFNGDDRVDLTDFGILKGHFGLPGNMSQGDANLDGVVNLSDFGILKLNFGSSRRAFIGPPADDSAPNGAQIAWDDAATSIAMSAKPWSRKSVSEKMLDAVWANSSD
jgi:hypothetical protein